MRSLIFKVLPFVLALVLLQVAATADSKAAPPSRGDCDFDGTHYVVCYGDTLFSIGRKFGVYPYYIAQVNGIPNPNYIYAGQVLYIPEGDGWYNGWNDDCGDCQHQPPQRPKPQPSGYHCDYDNCNRGGYGYGYGYDYSGYYYDGYTPNYNRYSYTCGYNYNCY